MEWNASVQPKRSTQCCQLALECAPSPRGGVMLPSGSVKHLSGRGICLSGGDLSRRRRQAATVRGPDRSSAASQAAAGSALDNIAGADLASRAASARSTRCLTDEI